MFYSLEKMKLKWKVHEFIWKLLAMLKHFRHGSRSYQLCAFMCLLMFCASNFYALILWNSTTQYDRNVSFRLVQKRLRDSIGTSSDEVGCELPVLDAFSEEAMKFDSNVSKITCNGEDWVNCYFSKCRVKTEILNRFRNVVCNYKDIIYVNDDNYFIGATTRVTGDGKYYLNRSDHVKVSCSGIDKTGLGLLTSRWYGNKAGLRPVARKVPEGRENSMNVLILAFDSTSRLGFLRRMPRSYDVLTKELEGTVLKGFHIVGDGTPGTLFPLLSGKTELEHPYVWKKLINKQFLDPKSFIFRKIEVDGYHTAYFEDSPWIGTFQYRYNGFKGSPADHYLYAYFLEEAGVALATYHNFKYCQGDTPRYLFMLNLSRQVMENEGKKFCFTFISDISHDNFNMISVADNEFAEFLRKFKKSGKLNDTLLIVMGDHGYRFTSYRESYQGRLEERLPFLTVILPEKLKQERPEASINLKENDNVLTTPFDVHTTVLDVMGLKNLSNEFNVPGSHLPRGISLLDRIPKSRSCGQAGILSHWCVCTKWNNVSVSDLMYNRAAVFLAHFINNITLEQRKLCVERTLTSIEWVMRHRPNKDLLKYSGPLEHLGQFDSFVTNSYMVKPYVEEYQAKIVMAPGRAVYEGSMKYYLKNDRFTMSASEISRITAYSNEPHCVSNSHPHLNKYCYCRNKEVKKD